MDEFGYLEESEERQEAVAYQNVLPLLQRHVVDLVCRAVVEPLIFLWTKPVDVHVLPL